MFKNGERLGETPYQIEARPGEQIDRTINPTQNASFGAPPLPRTLVGPARPGFSFAGSDFWAQGVNVGVTVRF